MAYNKKNLFRKIVKIQEITLDKQDNEWMNKKQIYWQYIEPNYHISYRTYSYYLKIDAKKGLEKIKTI